MDESRIGQYSISVTTYGFEYTSFAKFNKHIFLLSLLAFFIATQFFYTLSFIGSIIFFFD